MNPEDIKKKLQEAGIPVDQPWQQTTGKAVQSPILERQKDLLTQLSSLLEQQIQADVAKVAELHAQLQTLKHGGGG